MQNSWVAKKALMRLYTLCKFEGFSKRTSSKLFIWNISLKCSEITEIVMRFQNSEISCYYSSSDNDKHMLMRQKCQQGFAYIIMQLT